jgi:hypothetical protein
MSYFTLFLVVLALVLFFLLAFRLVVTTRIDLSSLAMFCLTLAWLINQPGLTTLFKR